MYDPSRIAHDNTTAATLDKASLDAVTLAAVDWMVRLTSGHASKQDRSQFELWLQQNSLHKLAWDELALSFEPIHHGLHHVLDVNQRAPGQAAAARQALTRQGVSKQRRKLLGNGLAVLMVSAGAAYTVNRWVPLANINSDYSTATAERRTILLADGSQIILNARSAIDVHFNATQRLVRLHSGECIVRVSADVGSGAARPFLVETRHGSVQALGTRFLVQTNDQRSFAMVQQHSVQVANSNRQQQTLQQGQAAWFDHRALQLQAANLTERFSWEHGVIDVRDQSLGEVIDALRPYRSGFIRISSQAASLRVFGVFQLDDPMRALQAMGESLPIRITGYGPWLVLIDSA